MSFQKKREGGEHPIFLSPLTPPFPLPLKWPNGWVKKDGEIEEEEEEGVWSSACSKQGLHIQVRKLGPFSSSSGRANRTNSKQTKKETK